MKNSITLRSLHPADPGTISQAFAAQGWDKPAGLYERYLALQQAGQVDVIVAEWEGLFAGYLVIAWQSDYPPFREAGIPEIVDMNVLIGFRRRGLATALMDEGEGRVAARSPVAGIGVGLLADYGPAQILYVRRGYLPDGRGLSRNGHWPEWGEMVRVDDELVLYLVKRVRG